MHKNDPTSETRKQDHIDLAFKAVVDKALTDPRFFYEPLLSAFPDEQITMPFFLAEKWMKFPVWVSSMTGGTQWAGVINKNLARACGEFGLGMGLGSCRSLLYTRDHFDDFDVRKYAGSNVPLFANLGIAQVEELCASGEYDRIHHLVHQLDADGLIVHVNPLQEFLQPEGDRFYRAPLDTIIQLLDHIKVPIIVKEVGQGMGPESLKALLKLPLLAIDFGAQGGTNFALLELMRRQPEATELHGQMTRLGHSAEEMLGFVNSIVKDLGGEQRCFNLIISGGVRTQTMRNGRAMPSCSVMVMYSPSWKRWESNRKIASSSSSPGS